MNRTAVINSGGTPVTRLKLSNLPDKHNFTLTYPRTPGSVSKLVQRVASRLISAYMRIDRPQQPTMARIPGLSHLLLR